MKDAAGNTPAPLTSYEKKWREKVQTGALNKGYDLLRKRQAMPLKEKVELSLERIEEWYAAFDGQVAVSYSGGKDSAVLLHLSRKLYPDIPAVFCNTGLEYPEILSLVRHTPNVTVMRPRIPFHHVIRDYGWPIISSEIIVLIETWPESLNMENILQKHSWIFSRKWRKGEIQNNSYRPPVEIWEMGKSERSTARVRLCSKR